MAIWSDTNTISSEDLLKFFPVQCFPDIDGLKLHLGKKSLHICGEDSNWALQSDMSLAVGSGCMIFFYTGELRFRLEDSQGNRDISVQEAQQTALPKTEELRLVKRGEPWEFVFDLSGEGRLTIYAGIISLSWQPDETE